MADKKVLVIDDDVELLEGLQEMFDLFGYDSIAINDSIAALSVAQVTKPDVILVDIKMKGLNGFQVADRLNQHEETADIPVIALSGYFMEEEHNRLMRMLGIKEFVRKPFNPIDVISRIEMLLEGSSKISEQRHD